MFVVSTLVLFVLLRSFAVTQGCGIQKAATNVDIGKDAEIGEFPWVVMLRYGGDNEKMTKCVGSLINERFVLTSAVCATSSTSPKLNSVRLGEYNSETDKDCDTCTVQDIEVDEVISHQYNKTTHEHDIALLKLKTNAEFNDYVKPICLPLSEKQRGQSGDKVATSGWGISKTTHKQVSLKKKVISKILELDECQGRYKNAKIKLTENHLCTDDLPNNKEATCAGDAGGPIMLPKDDKWYQVGIVSFGVGCGTEFPDVNTRVDRYLDWINEIIN